MARDEALRQRPNPNYAVRPPAPQLVNRLTTLCMSRPRDYLLMC